VLHRGEGGHKNVAFSESSVEKKKEKQSIYQKTLQTGHKETVKIRKKGRNIPYLVLKRKPVRKGSEHERLGLPSLGPA